MRSGRGEEKPVAAYFRPLLRTVSGHALISASDRPDALVDALLASSYPEEFCLSLDFSPPFLSSLMRAGFLVMSGAFDSGRTFVLLAKLHLERSVLFFPELHTGASLRRVLGRYELRADDDFPRILDRCAQRHGDGWLTPPLRESLVLLNEQGGDPVPVAFGLYRDGELKAGEIGVRAGRAYTSYSGFYAENSAGSAQLTMTAAYLRDSGFAFMDLGMPMEYKRRLGARPVSRVEFVAMFRAAANCRS
ncbi:MAG: GNAT family N-acetyltransferase [Desulfovibrio sp.]|jgi:Leu/Phe-tRNA-protein transferase|nr:GNAT family N-acetyltransferase [Desulfovibrio sp.]